MPAAARKERVKFKLDPRLLRLVHEVQDELTLEEKARIEAIMRAPRVATMSFRQFTNRVNPRFRFNPHNTKVAKVLQRVADGELKRVIILEPPRHGKSEQISRLFPAYYLYRHPEQWVGVTAYGAELAQGFSRTAREYYGRAIGWPEESVSTVKHWETGEGGGMWAAGIGGAITGKGFHLGIIDDPVKNAKEAASKKYQRNHQEWYESTFYTRAEPNAAIVITLTRWNEADLVGWLLTREVDEPERWHIIHLPAIAEQFPPVNRDGEPMYPASCTLEPDDRAVGEALAPRRYPKERLLKIKRRIRPYFWNALFQQRPIPPEGNLLKREWFPIRDTIPEPIVARVRWWDRASTAAQAAEDPDYTAGGLAARGQSGRFYLEDLVFGQWPAGTRDKHIRNTVKNDRNLVPQPHQWGEQEPGSAGKDMATQFRIMLAGVPVRTEPSTGTKEDAVDSLAAQAEIGNVTIIRGAWNNHFLNEAADFPFGSHDDSVEAFGKAIAKLSPLASADPAAYGTYRR